jgi:hypothetical protein
MSSRARNLRRLRRRCEAVVRRLPIPVPFDVRTLCQNVAAQRGKPIRLVAMSSESQVLGMWVGTDAADLIFYEQATTRPHQDHIILHELSHLLCDHYPAKLTGSDHFRMLTSNLDPEMVRRVLARTTYQAAEEQEAELLASLIQQHGNQLAASSHQAGSVLAERIEAAFDCHDQVHLRRPWRG